MVGLASGIPAAGLKFIQNRLNPALVFLFQLVVLVAFAALPLLAIQSLGASFSNPITRNLHLQQIPAGPVISYFTGLVFLTSSLYMFAVRRQEPAGRAFALFTAAAAFVLAGSFELATTQTLISMWTFSLSVAGGSLVNVGMVFPREIPVAARYPILRWAGYGPALGLFLLALPDLFSGSLPVLSWWLQLGYLFLAAVFFLATMVMRRISSTSPIVREQANLILWSAGISISPVLVWAIVRLFSPSLTFPSYLLLPFSVFPLLTNYASLRYRLLNTDYVLSRAVLYALLTVLAVCGYALLVSGLTLVFGSGLGSRNPFVVGLMVFLLALLLNPLRVRLQEAVDGSFFRGQVVFRDRLQTFGRDLTQAIELPEILSWLRKYAHEGLLPSQLHLFLHDYLSDSYSAVPNETGRITSELRFASSSPLVRILTNRRGFLFIGGTVGGSITLPPALQAEQARLALLGCQLFIPLPGRQTLIGWLALGPRLSGEPYTHRDLSFLESLCGQAALAVERAQVMVDLERRVREMNVLARVAQGTSFTVTFDDILELIYAQTCQIIPTEDFRVTLFDPRRDALVNVFSLERDERLGERENQPVPTHQGLEGEVVRLRRGILTEDYEHECRGRGCLPAVDGMYAWIGVPLNAGAETIGVISIGSRDPNLVYTDEQDKLLQAIADQASGAIVKARLLQEAEDRARQLATLNEIGRILTSTLEPNTLLNQILMSAAEILNCRAGSLFLVDPQTSELVFEVVIGPVASDLIGKRLPPGKGLVGEAVFSRRAIIANDVKRRKEWFETTDQQTGFDTQDLLVVPMQVKERVIGVIEVINKVDGSPFTMADQELLTTFTSQATIAIENARLYTMTDQALAERVEELSIMQRIDRELNAGLDMNLALHITLEWAMRHSGAEAGLAGILEKEGLRVAAVQGYPETVEIEGADGARRVLTLTNDCIPLDLPLIRTVIQTGQPQCWQSKKAAAGSPGPGPLNGGKSRAVIPIRREEAVIGLLLLESSFEDAYPPEMIAFLARLSDHAAIAIANAQLYGEVQAANLAKSKFVSFVAHELKNPMASIKGYTELVSKGMAGPVNEMQTSFLATVRSNVDRMNTIVSDLNDLTKIQVGSLRLGFKTVRLQDTLEEVIRSLSRHLEEKRQQLSLDLPVDLPVVWADPGRLSQVLTNLVSNAYKYTPDEGKIDVGAERCGAGEGGPAGMEAVHLWVRDTGIGIPLEDQGKIFQQYFRTEISKETASGTGLGLSISKSLVEMQGGRIWFESEPGKGSIFHITVPLADPDQGL